MIADTVKEGAKEALAAMKRVGVKKTVMLTGDRLAAAEHVAAELGIDEVHAELLPGDKVSNVEALLDAQEEKEKLAFVGDGINDAPVLTRADIGFAMGSMGSDAKVSNVEALLDAQEEKEKLAFVGDGINDAPVLTRADIGFAMGSMGSDAAIEAADIVLMDDDVSIGFAMGSMGSDAAIEAADIVLMDDDVRKIAAVVRIARRTLAIVKQNILRWEAWARMRRSRRRILC